MKLIENRVEEYIQKPGLDGVYEAIRDAAAVCYQTDVAKSKKTPKEFVEDVILKKGHGRALEFGTVYLYGELDDEDFKDVWTRYNNPYSKIYCDSPKSIKLRDENNKLIKEVEKSSKFYITTNMRVIMNGDYKTDKEALEHNYDKNYLSDLKYMVEPMKQHYKRRTFMMDISRGCADDFRTHITLSSMCESSRWCNFSKGKFGSQLTFIKPYWFGKNKVADSFFKSGLWFEEKIYLALAKKFNLQAQQLKRVFPLGAKAELRLCGFDDAWENFLWRRCDAHADPECIFVAHKIKTLLYESKG